MDDGRRIAVVDLGTNSTRLLVADVDEDGTLQEIDRRTDVTRLGEGVDATGRLADDAMERVFARLAAYRELDRRARRRAGRSRWPRAPCATPSTARSSKRLVRERFGFDVRTITGEEEARLTFLGATAGRDPASGPTLVIDIGGGSTEYVVGTPGEAPDFHVSTRMGSVRHTERHLAERPAGARASWRPWPRRPARPSRPRSPPRCAGAVERGIAVAGTATSLAAIDQELDPYDPERVHGYRLALGACERMLAMLAALPLDERREVAGPAPRPRAHDRRRRRHPGRVDARLRPRRVEVSEADILHGAALDAALYGGEQRVRRR